MPSPPVKKVARNFANLMKKTHPSERHTRKVSQNFVNLMIAASLIKMKKSKK